MRCERAVYTSLTLYTAVETSWAMIRLNWRLYVAFVSMKEEANGRTSDAAKLFCQLFVGTLELVVLLFGVDLVIFKAFETILEVVAFGADPCEM